MIRKEKLTEACKGLGINMLEVSRFVKISEEPLIACWGFDKIKKENFIYINPKVLRFSIDQIQLILRHEILHWAGYREVKGANDVNLLNIALDITINKILTLSYEKKMKLLSRKIYPEETKNTILVLAEPHLTPEAIEIKELKEIWENIWLKEEIPSPASVYYKIFLEHNGEKEREIWLLNPFGTVKNNGSGILLRSIPEGINIDEDKFAKIEEHELNKIMEAMPWNLKSGFSNQMSEIFSLVLVGKKAFNLKKISSFIRRLETRQKLDEVSGNMIKSLDGRSSSQLYPYQLSRLGIIYVACGISKIIPIFWNKLPETRKNKLAIYIDTSPSMDSFKEEESFLVDELKEYFPTKIFAFAGDVWEISAEDFAQGKYMSGYSTSFDVVVEHIVNSDSDVGIVFTDGYSSISSENKKEFKDSRKRLFSVYFSEDDNIESDLDEISERKMIVNVKEEKNEKENASSYTFRR